MRKYELVVVGGGFAGVAAAIAAARAGVDVLLVDKGNCLGGAAVNCLVSPFMPYSTVIDGKHVVLSAGIFSEIIRRMDERNAMVGDRFFLEEELKFVLSDMVLEAGVKLLFHAYIFKAEKRDGRITSISVATKSGETKIEADYFVDATGDAQLAFLADCPTTLGREPDHLCKPMTLCFRVGNVDRDRFYASQPKWSKIHAERLEAGQLINP